MAGLDVSLLAHLCEAQKLKAEFAGNKTTTVTPPRIIHNHHPSSIIHHPCSMVTTWLLG